MKWLIYIVSLVLSLAVVFILAEFITPVLVESYPSWKIPIVILHIAICVIVGFKFADIATDRIKKLENKGRYRFLIFIIYSSGQSQFITSFKTEKEAMDYLISDEIDDIETRYNDPVCIMLKELPL